MDLCDEFFSSLVVLLGVRFGLMIYKILLTQLNCWRVSVGMNKNREILWLHSSFIIIPSHHHLIDSSLTRNETFLI